MGNGPLPEIDNPQLVTHLTNLPILTAVADIRDDDCVTTQICAYGTIRLE